MYGMLFNMLFQIHNNNYYVFLLGSYESDGKNLVRKISRVLHFGVLLFVHFRFGVGVCIK